MDRKSILNWKRKALIESLSRVDVLCVDKTGTITENTILLWDEPEANLNPEFLPVIADCLLSLSRQHVQILISTHSYILAKYIEIRAKDTDKVLFHSLYKKDDGLVYDEQQKKFSALQNNTIVTAFEALMDEI